MGIQRSFAPSGVTASGVRDSAVYPYRGSNLRPRVQISDDHPVMVNGIRQIVETEFEVVGTSASGPAAQEMTRMVNPDGIIIGVTFLAENTLAVIRGLRSFGDNLRILVYCENGYSELVRETRRAGANGWLLKTSPPDKILVALREVLRGNMYLGAGLGETIIIEPPRRLTPRQAEVIRLVAMGKSAKDIASELNISRKTVEFHKAAILSSLQLQNTAQVIKYAIERGLLNTPAEQAEQSLQSNGNQV